MSQTQKKKTLSQSKAPVMGPPSFMQDKLTIPPAIAAEIKAKNLDVHWINYKKYVENGGMHENGWEAYKRESKPTGAEAAFMGAGTDGYLRRGDCLLATRPKEQGDQHRAWIRYQADLLERAKIGKRDALRSQAESVGGTFEDDSDEE